MTGFQNKTDSPCFFARQLGRFINLQINAGTIRGVKLVGGVTPAAGVINIHVKSQYTALQSKKAVSAYL